MTVRLAALLASLLLAGSAGLATASAGPLSPPLVQVAVGERFEVTGPVTLPPGQATAVAHLDVVSLTPDVYVDPEDWSSNRSQFVTSSGTTTLRWPVQAVNAGRFHLYVTLSPLPGPGAVRAAPVRIGDAVLVEVSGRPPLSSAGTGVVAGVVPAVLLVGYLLTRRRLRRTA